MSEQPDALDDLIGTVEGHPLWSTTDAADIPRLLAEIDRLRGALKAVIISPLVAGNLAQWRDYYKQRGTANPIDTARAALEGK